MKVLHSLALFGVVLLFSADLRAQDVCSTSPAAVPTGFVTRTAFNNTATAAADICLKLDSGADITVDLSSGGVITGGTASKCVRFDGSGNLVAAGDDCVTGIDTTTTPPSSGDLLKYDGSNFTPVEFAPIIAGSQPTCNGSTPGAEAWYRDGDHGAALCHCDTSVPAWITLWGAKCD